LDVPLQDINKITHDTYVFTFGLPTPDVSLGLETGQHIIIQYIFLYSNLFSRKKSANLANKDQTPQEIQRKYTPVSRMNQTVKLLFTKLLISTPLKGIIRPLGKNIQSWS